MMNEYMVLAIGLNVGGSEPLDQLDRTWEVVSWGGLIYESNLFESEWNGVKERAIQFLVERSDFGRSEEQVRAMIAAIASELDQEAIAYIEPERDRWTLVRQDGEVEDGGSVAEFPIRVTEVWRR